jgi:hypothetical protein
MNLKIKIGFIAIAGLLAFTACKKTETITETVLQPNPAGNSASLQDLKNYLAANLDNASQAFTIDEDAGQTITGLQGTVVTISPNTFVTMTGAPVTGNIQVNLVEIFSKKDMILMNAATMGRGFSGAITPLISGGEMKITATQGGQKLKLAPGMGIQFTVPAGGGTDPNMTLFYGEGGENPDTLVWNQVDSTQFQGTGSTYNFWSDSINWINCDYFWSATGPQTTVQVTPTSGFNNTNMLLFMSFDGLSSISNLYHFTGGNFTTAPSYTLPIGLPVHFIAIAMIGGNPHVAIVSSTIVNNHIEVLPTLTQMTTAQLAAALSALP